MVDIVFNPFLCQWSVEHGEEGGRSKEEGERKGKGKGEREEGEGEGKEGRQDKTDELSDEMKSASLHSNSSSSS